METEQERLNETETVELTASLPVVDQIESTSDQEPKPVETEQEGPHEFEIVQPTTSARVQDELESRRDQIPSPVETLKNCFSENLTMECSTSGPVLDEMRNYEADDVYSVSDNVEDRAELKEQMRVLQEQLCQVRVFLFSFTFISIEPSANLEKLSS